MMIAPKRSFCGVLPIAGFVMLVAAGCAKNDPKKMLEGTWRVKSPTAAVQGVPNLPPQQAQMLQQMMANMTLDFRPDGGFTMTMGAPIVGKWTMSEKKVTMSVDSVAGRPLPANAPPAAKSFTADLDMELGTLTIAPQAGSTVGTQSLVFAKPAK